MGNHMISDIHFIIFIPFVVNTGECSQEKMLRTGSGSSAAFPWYFQTKVSSDESEVLSIQVTGILMILWHTES